MAEPVGFMPGYSFGQPAMPQQPILVSGRSVSLTAAGIPPILFKIAQTIGLRYLPSLSKVMRMVRQMSKYLAPTAVATALGIELSELAKLITVASTKKRRHINPANTKALRRSLRRLESFDRLACRVSTQLSAVRGGSRRQAPRRGRCRTCKRRPCAC